MNRPRDAATQQRCGTPLARLLGALEHQGCRCRRAGAGWQAQCPAHEDRLPSLSLREGDDGRVLIHCFAGCESREVLRVLGLEFRDLYPLGARKRNKRSHTPQ